MRSSLLRVLFLASSFAFVACGSSDDGTSSTSDSSTTSDTASGGDSSKTDSSSTDSCACVDTMPADSTTGDSSTSDTATGDTPADSVVDAPADASDATDGTAAKCTGDGDCRTFAVQCGGKCECLALASSEPDPTCTDPTECFVNPCVGKTAHCSAGGVCVIG